MLLLDQEDTIAPLCASIIIINTLVCFFFLFFMFLNYPLLSCLIVSLHCIVVFVTKHYSVCDLLVKNKNKYKNCVCSKL